MTEWINDVGNIILAGSAAIGAIVAIVGLKAWKTQLRGREDHELARRLLVSLFQYRDAIRQVRNPGIFADEMPGPPADEATKMSDDQRRHYGLVKAYQNRWARVDDSRKKLYPDLLEANALWGQSVSDFFDFLFALEQELLRNVRNQLRSQEPNSSERTKEAYRKILDRHREVLYEGDMESGDDPFQQEFAVGMENIEEFLKGKLITKAA